MTDRRFDNRTKTQFKKDIKFGTGLESYFFQVWMKHQEHFSDFVVESWSDNGVGNDGEFVKSGTSTAGADYRATFSYGSYLYEDMPLEVKWVPTAGKFTLKIADMRAYVKEEAGILFVYNTDPGIRNLRKPKDYDWDAHISNIEDAAEANAIRWGIMFPEDVQRLYDKYVDNCYPIPYMGNKMGFILPSEEFDNWFVQEAWYGEGLV